MDRGPDEMNFQKEAANLEEFTYRNKDVAYVRAPRLFREFTTSRVLVQEYIAGYAIDDKAALTENGYDLNEIGSKFADNFMKQVLDDGFFHADPHPGNVRICEGKIVWIDMGMMGRLTDSDRELISMAVKGVAVNDVGMIEDAVLAIGEFRGTPDKAQLYKGIEELLSKYRTVHMGDIDVTGVMQDLMEVMKTNKITMPHGLTMLARGLTHMEGVLADISPDINMMEIAAARMKEHLIHNLDLKDSLISGGKKLYRSLHRAVNLPEMASEALEAYLRGQSRMNLDLHVSKEFSDLLRHLIRNIVMGLWIMALLISSSIICTTDMQPKIWGIPAIGAFGYVMAFIIVMYVFIRHFLSKK